MCVFPFLPILKKAKKNENNSCGVK